MKIISTEFPDVYIFEPDVYRDTRGYFYEKFNSKKLKDTIEDFQIIQGNQSKSKRGVIRGLHFQKPPYAQAKIVEVTKGFVLDIIVDIRTDSPTFGQYLSIELSGTNKKILFVPRGFAHGFITLSNNALFQYYVDNYYSPNHEGGIKFDDTYLNIDWKLKKHLIVSEKDRKLSGFKEQSFFTKAEFLALK